MLRLLDDFDCTFGTLHLTGTADETVINVYGNRLSVFHFVNAYRASVNTCFASSAFRYIDFDFNH